MITYILNYDDLRKLLKNGHFADETERVPIIIRIRLADRPAAKRLEHFALLVQEPHESLRTSETDSPAETR